MPACTRLRWPALFDAIAARSPCACKTRRCRINPAGETEAVVGGAVVLRLQPSRSAIAVCRVRTAVEKREAQYALVSVGHVRGEGPLARFRVFDPVVERRRHAQAEVAEDLVPYRIVGTAPVAQHRGACWLLDDATAALEAPRLRQATRFQGDCLRYLIEEQ